MSDATSTVFVIDDDPDLRASVVTFSYLPPFPTSLNPSAGWRHLPGARSRMPGQSGLDLQCELAAAKREIPIIFITGHGDIPMSVQAMKRGAIEFLTKPFRDQDLLDAIQLGLSRDAARRENDKDLAVLRERFAS